MATISKYLFLLSTIYLLLSTSCQAASFKISPSTGTFNQNCQSSVDIILDAEGGTTNAADIIIEYDPVKIEIVDSDSTTTGVQIKPGSVYQSYFGNVVDSSAGTIRLTGASFTSSFTSRGTFATIQFKPRLNNSTGNFNIRFTGASATNTLDSNIADTNTSNDLLTTTQNATLTFSSGVCVKDTTPPTIAFIAPTQGQSGVPSNFNPQIQVSDAGSGVSLTTVEIIINGVTYTSANSRVTTTGTATKYSFTISPIDPFPSSQASTILVKATDLSGNFRQSSITFNFPTVVYPTSTPVPTCALVPDCPTCPLLASPTPPSAILTQTALQTDTSSPLLEFIEPIYPNLQFQVSDSGSGISSNTIKVTLDGQTYTLKDSKYLTSHGTANSYLITLHPKKTLASNQSFTLVASASDMAGNGISKSITFNTQNITAATTSSSPLVSVVNFFNTLNPFSSSSTSNSSTSVSPTSTNPLANFIFALILSAGLMALIYFLSSALFALIRRVRIHPYGFVYRSDNHDSITKVDVTVINDRQQKVATCQTNSSGIFAAPPLPPGKYKFVFHHPQFSFPSITNTSQSVYPHQYYGQIVTTTTDLDLFLTVPLDPIPAPKNRLF